MTQPALFPEPEAVNPPDRCPKCGMTVRRITFLEAHCVSCPYVWRREGQLHHSEPFPEGF